MESEKGATERGAVIWLAALNPGVLEVVRRAGLDKRLGRERLLFNARAVIERYQASGNGRRRGAPRRVLIGSDPARVREHATGNVRSIGFFAAGIWPLALPETLSGQDSSTGTSPGRAKGDARCNAPSHITPPWGRPICAFSKM